VRTPETHDAIGDRAFAGDPATVTRLARATAEGLLDLGVLPVLKHAPGHGRARVDSHLALPEVEAPLAELRAVDFAPFRALADLPWAMTAHVRYRAIDAAAAATVSSAAIGAIRGEIGFDGFLVSDDLSMKALGGALAERARAALAAGCDAVLHCTGRRDEMEEIVAEVPALSAAARARFARGLARRGPRVDSGERASWDRRLTALLQAAAA
jgi:beta-N-acetylhexosaminidase